MFYFLQINKNFYMFIHSYFFSSEVRNQEIRHELDTAFAVEEPLARLRLTNRSAIAGKAR